MSLYIKIVLIPPSAIYSTLSNYVVGFDLRLFALSNMDGNVN